MVFKNNVVFWTKRCLIEFYKTLFEYLGLAKTALFFEVLILQDRAIDSEHAGIPSLLATSAVHHHLIRKGMRSKVGIIVEAGDVWEVHHFACLIGFGATAINPYLALSSIRDMKESGRLQTELGDEELKKNYIKAVNEGLLKVFSKMGISTLQSYQGAQIFEIIGLNNEVVDKYFTGATSRIQGMGLDEIATEVAPGAHAILILDQAGWHGAKDLRVPSNISLLPLPPRSPELNPQENIWQFMRQNWLSNRVFKSFDDILDHCCYAWRTLIDQPWKIMSIARRDWATVGQSI